MERVCRGPPTDQLCSLLSALHPGEAPRCGLHSPSSWALWPPMGFGHRGALPCLEGVRADIYFLFFPVSFLKAVGVSLKGVTATGRRLCSDPGNHSLPTLFLWPRSVDSCPAVSQVPVLSLSYCSSTSPRQLCHQSLCKILLGLSLLKYSTYFLQGS